MQSADLALDARNNAIIVWTDDAATASSVSSALYLTHFNSSGPQQSRILELRGSFILWPSLAVGNNGTVNLTWTQYTPDAGRALVEYGMLGSGQLTREETIASYSEASAIPPVARLDFDNSSGHFQIAWGESQSDLQPVSTINCATLVSNGTIIAKVQVAKFNGTLRDLSINPLSEQGGAFVIWRTEASNASVYISKISEGGHFMYLKELNYTRGYPKYFAVSTDFENNLYFVWYQPSIPTPDSTSSTLPRSANLTYMRMNSDGIIVQTGTGEFRAPVIGVTVLSDGTVYGISAKGLVRLVRPTQEQHVIISISAIALMGCMSLAGFGGSVLIEEGRYRWVALYSMMTRSRAGRSRQASPEILRLLARKPGLKLRDIKRLTEDHPVGTLSLIRMERNGLLASFRDGLSRRFYVRGTETGQVDALRTRILLLILDHPGIWEAQLAKDLGLSQQTVHYHLKKLREAKLITPAVDANGSRKLYRAADSVPENQKQIERQ
jgi:DNA-binding transcriptional ArsR family regulator